MSYYDLPVIWRRENPPAWEEVEEAVIEAIAAEMEGNNENTLSGEN